MSSTTGNDLNYTADNHSESVANQEKLLMSELEMDNPRKSSLPERTNNAVDPT